MSNAPETNTETNATQQTTTTPEENRWVLRLEELLKVKNVDDLRSELTKLAGEIQTEIQNFDLNAHLSPEAKTRLKSLEQNYNEVMRTVQKAQKEFDREFNKRLRVLKRTKQDAEKQIKNIKARITKHRGTILKASNDLKKRLKNKTKKSGGAKRKKTTTRKSATT